jgi:hypothetical protein
MDDMLCAGHKHGQPRMTPQQIYLYCLTLQHPYFFNIVLVQVTASIKGRELSSTQVLV